MGRLSAKQRAELRELVGKLDLKGLGRDLVPLVRVLVGIGEVGIELVALKMNVRIRVRSHLPGLLHGQVAGIEHLQLRVGFSCPILRKLLRPVITVIPHRADDLFLGDDLQHPAQVAFEPVLRSDWPWIAAALMLVVVHQDDAVGGLGQRP